MPESFDGMLAELADAAAMATPLPDVSRVRRRAHERTVHRRMAASALALVVLGTCGGIVTAAYGRFAPKSQAAASAPAATAEVRAGTASPAAVGRGAAAPTPDPSASTEADAAAYSAVAGTWQAVGSGQYLIVFPDGGVGMAEKGAWQLCDGRLTTVGSGVFYVDELACGDYGTTGLTLQSTAKGSELSLAVPASGSTPVSLIYQRTAAAPTVAADHAVLAKLVGVWSSGTADKREVVVAGNGSITLVGLSSGGGDVKYTGTVTGYYTDSVRVEIPCAAKPGMQTGAECGVLEVDFVDAKEIAVVGSGGSETFMPTANPSTYAAGPPSGAAASVFSTSFADPTSAEAVTPTP